MATTKEAVQNASAFAIETLGPERTSGLQLEEVESANADGQDAWLITLSMIAPPTGPFDISVLAESKRESKINHRSEEERRSYVDENPRACHDVMLDARTLIEKHRSKGVLVDTNLLVLLLVGSVNKRRMLSFKRTSELYAT